MKKEVLENQDELEIQKNKKIKIQKICKKYSTLFTILLLISVLVTFPILWVTETNKGNGYVSVNILYGNTMTLLTGLLFCAFSSLVYASNLKKFSMIKWIITVATFLIGFILMNSVPILIIGSFVILLFLTQMWFNWENFKEFFGKMGNKNKLKTE